MKKSVNNKINFNHNKDSKKFSWKIIGLIVFILVIFPLIYFFSTGKKLRFRLKTDTTKTLIASSGTLLTGQWTHVAAVYDGTNMKLYKDGVEVGATTKTGTISKNSNVPVWIGSNPTNNYGQFDGLIDEVKVFDRALTSQEIKDLMTGTPSQSVCESCSTCSSDCGQCSVCGNGNIDTGEICDSNQQSCTVNNNAGVKNCLSDCSGFGQCVVTATGNQWYVTPTGSSTGDGSINKPWNLQTALNHPASVKPGDTIWLREGTYKGVVTSYLKGTATARITVRAYPGEKVKIDLYDGSPAKFEYFSVHSDYVDYRDLEILNTGPGLRSSSELGQTGAIAELRGSLDIDGVNNRIINSIIHDVSNGIGFWKQATGGEIYGSIIYHNGWYSPPAQQGHGIYTQNYDTAVKYYRENIIFNNSAYFW